MSLSINTNLMARNVARNLGSSYSRLSTSVRRLASGLRVNAAADDAAGLAIRELMRADVTSLHQGMRNANDAVSMIQTADGALAVIDEKLIRMKELAEQAATGTYDSTQRTIISSEYQAMADEIDRIARATDFNGIKLLDGSLSGAHDGKGLASTGAMKIHFGSGNDSAEDYYYVEIGACTAAALGLGHSSTYTGSTIRLVAQETFVQEPMTVTPQTSYVEYTDPDTGDKYYSDGNNYFSDISKPGSTKLDWETDREVIERLRMEQDTTTTSLLYYVYIDPKTNIEYYSSDNKGTFISDTKNPTSSQLDSSNPADKAVIDRLVYDSRTLRVVTTWHIYEDPTHKKYYSCDDGRTFVPNANNPFSGLLDISNPKDKATIDTFKPTMVVKKVNEPAVPINYKIYRVPGGWKDYYSSDDGKTFVTTPGDPDNSKLDPVADRDLIAQLEPAPETRMVTVMYAQYTLSLPDGTKKVFYTPDGGRTFYGQDSSGVADLNTVVYDINNAADAAVIATLVPSYDYAMNNIKYSVYEDTTNSAEYYSGDDGKSFFTDPNDPKGSRLDSSDPGYAALVANFKKIDRQLEVSQAYTRYRDSSDSRTYWSCDGGQTFVSNYNKPDDIALDATNPAHQAAIADLHPVPLTPIGKSTRYECYRDPATGTIYYTPEKAPGSVFLLDINNPGNIALDSANPADQAIINRLEVVQRENIYSVQKSFPDKYLVYEDSRNGTIYYSPDEGKTIVRSTTNPYTSVVDPTLPGNQDILDNLRPLVTTTKTIEYVKKLVPGGGSPAAGYTISTQGAAQRALVAIDRAIVSKDKIRAHLGALQNRLENTVSNLSIQAETLQVSESRISDTDVATEMTEFVRSQILSQTGVAMLAQANSLPRMLASLIGG